MQKKNKTKLCIPIFGDFFIIFFSPFPINALNQLNSAGLSNRFGKAAR